MIHSHTPDVSIIVPVYNVEKKLCRCIDSLLHQTFSNIEIILVDDGSSDGSGILCDTYSKQDARIAVIHKENGGVSSARNIGIKAARGNYIMFCDSDDYVMDTWVEKLYAMMESPSIYMAICGWKNEEQAYLFFCQTEQKTEIALTPPFVTQICNHNLAHTVWNKIFIRDLIINNGIHFLENVHHSEDTIFVMQYMQTRTLNIGIVNEPLYFYSTDNNQSLSQKYIDHYWDYRLIAMEEFKKALLHTGEALTSDFYTNYIYTICCVINNNFRKDNPHNRLEKYREGVRVLHSKECKIAFCNGNFDEYHPIYTMILKTRCYFFVLMFHYLIKIKHKLWGERDL